MSDDPHLNPRPKGFTAFFKRAGESTTAFFRRSNPSGGSSILVGGFIGSAATANEIIERGIRGETISIWHAMKFLFFFAMASCHAYNLWKSDPNARPK